MVILDVLRADLEYDNLRIKNANIEIEKIQDIINLLHKIEDTRNVHALISSYQNRIKKAETVIHEAEQNRAHNEKLIAEMQKGIQVNFESKSIRYTEQEKKKWGSTINSGALSIDTIIESNRMNVGIIFILIFIGVVNNEGIKI